MACKAVNFFRRSAIRPCLTSVIDRTFSLKSTEMSSAVQKFKYFMVLDFEATCEEHVRIQPHQEIIEFPVVKINSKTLEEEGRFHHYVQPTERPFLTSFCTNLTGIIQETVSNEPSLPEILKEFDEWLESQNLIIQNEGTRCANSWTFVTCGDWDIGTLLLNESIYRNLSLPSYFHQWINLKKAYGQAYGHFPVSMSLMLSELGLQRIVRF